MTSAEIRRWPVRGLLGALALGLSLCSAMADTPHPVVMQQVTDWKSVYGVVQPRREVPARARLGGTLEMLDIIEGQEVEAGQVLGRVVDLSLEFRLAANAAQLEALQSQLDNAQSELTRGEELLARGVTTVQRIDALRTQVEVLQNQIVALQSEGRVITQQLAEGEVLAPIAGRVLTVPVAAGAVLMPGEPVATIGGGGIFLRLAVPERHAPLLTEGDPIEIDTGAGAATGRLARIYPQIENGRVLADVEVEGLDARFVNARVLVRLPIGTRDAILVPEAALTQRFGLDYIRVGDTDPREVVVRIGERHDIDGHFMVEILAGVSAGAMVIVP
ncbi:efflux RND transporter periplasmic adaptor subunit [Roseicyclus mahoneyensis]|uniref:RND family efflux transporter MFP subunit n=1 Tax=Roseicyclus mahoneyensis TaxID=164332 RepID=A0A316GLC9_9RHOB|nr:efflux RND transporter periplasmic adaptor subunit [Roseicyclus mahoneyensis]PWK61497.1 RND family efflux transporter MFP subunit [Roseicyclus mahoneyensis]